MTVIKVKTATRKLKLELNEWRKVYFNTITDSRIDVRVPETSKILDAWGDAIDELEKQIEERESEEGEE